MKQLLALARRLLFREPELPPPVTIGYLLVLAVVLGSGIALTIVSTLLYVRTGVSSYLASVVLGASVLVIGTAEFLPIRWRGGSAVLRIAGIILVLVVIWLFVR